MRCTSLRCALWCGMLAACLGRWVSLTAAPSGGRSIMGCSSALGPGVADGTREQRCPRAPRPGRARSAGGGKCRRRDSLQSPGSHLRANPLSLSGPAGSAASDGACHRRGRNRALVLTAVPEGVRGRFVDARSAIGAGPPAGTFLSTARVPSTGGAPSIGRARVPRSCGHGWRQSARATGPRAVPPVSARSRTPVA